MSRDGFHNIEISKRLVAKHVGAVKVFRFNFSGNGESEGRFSYANYHKEVEDLRAAIEYFTQVAKCKVRAIIGTRYTYV